MNAQVIAPGEGILHHPEGVDLMPSDSDRKTLRVEREKKIVRGHKEDDCAEEPTWQQTM